MQTGRQIQNVIQNCGKETGTESGDQQATILGQNPKHKTSNNKQGLVKSELHLLSAYFVR